MFRLQRIEIKLSGRVEQWRINFTKKSRKFSGIKQNSPSAAGAILNVKEYTLLTT